MARDEPESATFTKLQEEVSEPASGEEDNETEDFERDYHIFRDLSNSLNGKVDKYLEQVIEQEKEIADLKQQIEQEEKGLTKLKAKIDSLMQTCTQWENHSNEWKKIAVGYEKELKELEGKVVEQKSKAEYWERTAKEYYTKLYPDVNSKG